MRPSPALALATILTAAGPAHAAPADAVLPANLQVEVTTLRQGAVSRRMVAKVRPGERIVMRDEHETPYARVTGARGSKGASVTSGVVVTVVPLVVGTAMAFRFETVVKELSGFDSEDYVPEGSSERFVVKTPKVRDRSFDATVTSTSSPTQWGARQVMDDSGYAVDVVAKPIGK